MSRIRLTIITFILAFFSSCTGNGIFNQKSKDIDTETISTYYRVLVDDKYGFIDSKGRIVIEPQFDYVYTTFSEDICYAELGENKGIIDINGSFIVELPDSVSYISNYLKGLSRLSCGNDKIGIINKEGKIVIPAINKDARLNIDFDNTYIKITGKENQNDWYMADLSGEIIGATCDSILVGFRNGLCPVKKDGKWGYMNDKGEIVIEHQFDVAKTFSNDGLARVRCGKEWFFINKSGKKSLTYDKIITGMSKNRAVVIINGEKTLINKGGEIICKLDADKVSGFRDDNYAHIIKNNKAALIDTLGNIVLSTEYNAIETFEGGIAAVVKDDLYGYIDITGKEIIPVKYEDYISSLDEKGSPIRGVQIYENWKWLNTYYDLQGNLIWQDFTSSKKSIPYNPEREDFVEYFDSHLAELDPIEGIYYVTHKTYYQDRDNLNSIGLNDTKSRFYAIARNGNENEFTAHCTDGSGKVWVNNFVRIGETNNYAIIKGEEDSDFSSEGRVVVDSPAEFEFRLEQGHNTGYNFFITYEFVRDYPPMSEYEKIMKAEWTGSGFAIADGYIVTNYHVTSGANTILVRGINGDMNERLKGYVVASDKEHDISIIKIVDKDFETLGKIPYVVGKTMVDVGDNIFVLGYPMTDTMGEEVKLTDGIISAGSGYKGDASMYQISAAVQPGNSGGPVFNSEGNIVGIVCGKHSAAENANYAIKTSYLYSLINSANLGIIPTGENKIKDKELSKKVEQLKNYVYLIECSSK